MSETVELIKRIARQEVPVQTIAGKVTAVDKDKQTCTVEPSDGSPTLYQVRLRASIESTEQGHIVYPVEGSQVLVTVIQNNENVTFVSAVSEVDEVLIQLESDFKLLSKDGQVTMEVKDKYLELSKSGLYYEGNATDLKSELDKLLDGITQLTVPTAFGPSGVPINSATFVNIKTLLGQILK